MKPYAHQTKATRETVRDVLDNGFHALFMEVGTGKTKTILDAAFDLWLRHEIGQMLVCAPKSLVGTWKQQTTEHCAFPEWSFLAYDAQRSKTAKWSASFYDFLSRPSGVFPILFINTEAFQAPNPKLRAIVEAYTVKLPTLLVIDESSDIKSPKAKRSVNLTKLGQRCAARVIMTGTEVTNSVLDLYQQFEFLKPGFWGFKSFFFFKNCYAILEEKYLSGGRTYKEIVGYRKLEEIQAKIAPHTSRALKRDCLDLPPQIHATLPVEFSGPGKKAYDDLKKHLIALLDSGEVVTVANKVALFTKFRQLTGGTLAGIGVIDANSPKVSALMDEIRDHNEQAIIWSSFTEEINLLVKTVGSEWPCVRFDGLTNEKDREAAIDVFSSGKARFFIANPAAASQGLNLQNAHLQYWISLPTQAKQYEQGEGRTHRSGQVHPCLYKQIIAEGTVDERVAELLAAKTDIMLQFREGTVADMIDLV